MKRNLLIGLMTFSFAACASTGPSAYGPIQSRQGLGFANTQIEKDRFRVRYTGRNVDEARDYALLRAAEIALAEGYSHFKIIGGDTASHNYGRRSPVSTSVGIGIGRGGYGRYGGYGRGTRTNVGVGININDLARALEGDKVTESIEILLRRSGGDEPNIYNANSVAESIRPQIFQEEVDVPQVY